MSGWQKLCEGMKGLRLKVWTRRRHTHFFRELWQFMHFVEDYWQKSTLLGQKQCILHTILDLICNFAITRKNDAFVAKIASMRLTKTFVAIFAVAERLPTTATLVQTNRKSRPRHIDIGALFVLEERVLVINVNMQGLPRIRWSFQPSLRFVCSASVISHARQQANGQRKSKLKWK